MGDGRSITPEPTIPGWRVMLSDAGRYWATRERPFPNDVTEESLSSSPPFRTVDGDTFDELLDEVHRQEKAAARKVSS